MFIKKIENAIKSGSLKRIIKTRFLDVFIKNPNTRNRFMRDCALNKLRRKYSPYLNQQIDYRLNNNNKTSRSDFIWIFWRQGFENAPQIVKSCFHSIKSTFTDSKVIFLTECNLSEYITLPEFVEKKRRGG